MTLTAAPATTLADLSDADLFAEMDRAEDAADAAAVRGDRQYIAEQRRLLDTVEVALSRGYIMDAFNCTVGDRVTNRHGDTGTVTATTTGFHATVVVTWDTATLHRGVFRLRHMQTGALRHLDGKAH